MTKNKKNIAIFLMTLFVVSFLFFVFYDYAQAASPLVPCGKSTDVGGKNEKCSLCHLVIGIKGIIDWGRNILVAVALTAITAGGIMYIISAGDEQMMQTAKNLIKQALIGVVIVLGAWLIVNTTMYLLATKDNSATDLQGGTLGIQSSGWDKFSCTGGGSEGGEFTNDQPSCGETASTCTPGIPQTSCDGSWTCTNNLNDSVTCPSQLIPVCDNGSATPSCDAGCLGNEQNNADGSTSWTCTGSIVQSCSYVSPECGENSCECESGDVSNCTTQGTTSSNWICATVAGEQESCSWACTENQ